VIAGPSPLDPAGFKFPDSGPARHPPFGRPWELPRVGAFGAFGAFEAFDGALEGAHDHQVGRSWASAEHVRSRPATAGRWAATRASCRSNARFARWRHPAVHLHAPSRAPVGAVDRSMLAKW